MKLYQKFYYIPAITFCATILMSCQSTPINHNENPVVENSHWTYSGEAGPRYWSQLSDDNELCTAGRLQSPFNISADITASLPDLGFNYETTPMKIINNGHTIQVDQASGGVLNVGGKEFELLQFHFHSGSEYAIDNKFFPLEVHLVHASKGGELAVVGVMFEEGAANTELAEIWANMPISVGENSVAGKYVNVRNFLPANKKYFRFMGSLTTPPCSEGVNWHMMSEPITASASQISKFKTLYPMNARPLQDENNRLVVLGQ